MGIEELLKNMGSYLPLKKSCKRPQEGHVKFNSVEEHTDFIKDAYQRVDKSAF